MLLSLLLACSPGADDSGVAPDEVETSFSFTLPDTDQGECYSTSGATGCPAEGEEAYGQDAQYLRFAPAYDSDGEVVVDLVTGLSWQWEQLDDVAWSDAESTCEGLDLGGITTWRVPTIKETYSLIQFDGATGTAAPDDTEAPPDAEPYIDTDAFDFRYGGESGGRYIDVQLITSTEYVSVVFADDDGVEAGADCFFGVNLADGRIKCYPSADIPENAYQLRCVAGGDGYGDNDLEDLGDGTVADHATGLQWLQGDSGSHGAGDLGDGTMDWVDALAWCEGLDQAGHDDWRLPDARELQSIVDYGRSPDTTGSAAIDPLFEATDIVSEDGVDDYGWYWTSTTHRDGQPAGAAAVYVTFGEAEGYMAGPVSGQELVMDVHGAGAQRSDPKTGDRDDYPVLGAGPQGDVQRVFNLARCVRELD